MVGDMDSAKVYVPDRAGSPEISDRAIFSIYV